MGYHFASDTLRTSETSEHDIAIVHPIYGESEIGLRIDGVDHRAELLAGDEPGEAILELDGQRERVWLATQGDVHYIHLRGRAHRIEAVNALDRAREEAAPSGGADILRAPMPGVVVDVVAQVGAEVVRGELLMTIESMKLQTAINAVRDGVVAEIHLAAGDAFDQDAVLVRLEPELGADCDDDSEATEEVRK